MNATITADTLETRNILTWVAEQRGALKGCLVLTEDVFSLNFQAALAGDKKEKKPPCQYSVTQYYLIGLVFHVIHRKLFFFLM